MTTQSFRSTLLTGIVSLAVLGGMAQPAVADSRGPDRDRDRDRGSHYSRHDDRDQRSDDRRGREADRHGDRRDGDRHRYDYRRYDDRHRYDNKRYDDRQHHARHSYYDPRWQHYRSYPRRGYLTHVLPRNVIVVRHRHHRYWYGGGVWYASSGPGYMVVAPPLGVFVSLLPSYHTTVWFGGIPYYYANDAYYRWRAGERAYEVVEPPPGAQASTMSPAAEDIFVYPRAGQDEEQVASDRYECHRWASSETGFDPTRPEGGVPADQSLASRSDYLRAMTACLEGRGYSVA